MAHDGRVILSTFFTYFGTFSSTQKNSGLGGGGGGLMRELHLDLRVIKRPNKLTVLLQIFCNVPTRNDGPKSEWSSQRRVMAAKDFVFE